MTKAVTVIKLDPVEVEMFGGKAEDTERVAKYVATAIMELGYWDIVKQVIEEME